MEWEMMAVIVALVTVVVTIVIFIYSSSRESCARLIDNFNNLYQKTFSLRTELSAFSKIEYGEEFFYELDYIQLSSEIQEHLLDYMTEMEDFLFLVIGHRSASKVFEILMSLPLYQRMTAIYGFILKRRSETENHKCFLNYEKTLEKIGKMKKIRMSLPSKQNCYYIGIRSSDRMYDSNFFQDDITMFSDSIDSGIFQKRPNQNKMNKDFLPYLSRTIAKLIKKDDSCRFMFYNGKMAYGLSPELQKYFICLNSREVLAFFNNKPEEKRWFSENGLPVLPYETFLGHEIEWETLRRHFDGINCYVIQSSSGGGGIGTFLVSKNNFDTVQSILHPFSTYLISAYIKNSISVNTHIFISDKQTVLSPGSVQIVECEDEQLCYRGADFIAFRQIARSCRDQVRKLSLKIANRLREFGYRGVAGVDFLITEDESVYCMEINPRFQASTPLIDMYLRNQPVKNGMAHSVYELNEQAFRNQMISTLCFDDIIDFSCYYYYKGNRTLNALKEKHIIFESQSVIIHDDGFLKDADEKCLDADSYLFRAVFTHQICSVSPDMTLWLSDNIPVKSEPKDMLDLKIALLNQGVRISGHTEQIKSGTYESIDIEYSGKLNKAQKPVAINCAFGVNLSKYSPYEIVINEGKKELKGKLIFYGQELGDVEVEFNKLTELSEEDQKIIYLATDRLRIKLVKGCEYRNIGQGCAFCDLGISEKRFSIDEIIGALSRLKGKNIYFRHILIGGGTCLDHDIWEEVIELCKFLKQDEYYKNKPISLMSILPPEDYFQAFQKAGLEEVAFNLEVVDDSLAKLLMPGKRKNSKTAYYSAFSKAIEIFGVGNVRSALLVGFDKENELINEVRNLACIGVIPCLSAFRALNKSTFSNKIPPDNKTLRRVYDVCSELLAKEGCVIHELGPKCILCRNNMLSI